MARIVPPGFQLHKIKNAAERTVVDRLQHRLDDDWLIFVNVLLQQNGYDAESDIVLLHHIHGVAIVEVKGGHIELSRGQWLHTDRDPVAQMRRNRYLLQEKLVAATGNSALRVFAGICLPNSTKATGRFPDGLHTAQLLLAPSLEEPHKAIERMCAVPYRGPALTGDDMQAIIDYLAPSAQFTYDPNLVGDYVRRELDIICAAQVETLSCLEAHPRVFVSGRAGTGKTYLATKWTTRGLLADEDEEPKRVLLTCYNDPLAEKLRSQFADAVGDDSDEAPTLVVGAFLRMVLTLEGMPKIKVREDDPEFWMTELPAHLLKNWHRITQRFDRIIIDEAQDFSPAWIGMLESLLDPDGEGKFFLLADTHQEVVSRGFVAPAIAAGWVHGVLQQNVRNSRDIARLARHFLGGSAAPAALPASETFEGVRITRQGDVTAAVSACLDQLKAADVHPREVLVVTNDSLTRDQLREELRFVKVGGAKVGVACETAHRAKGLEYDAVIVAVGPKGITDTNLYVAVTRAVNHLFIVAPADVLERLRMLPDE